MGEAWANWRVAVARLYEVFAGYTVPPPPTGCPHCVKPEDEARIRARPLRDLSEEDLSYYAGKAMTTWGDSRQYRHFLPRLLELLIEAEDSNHLGWFVQCKLNEGVFWDAPKVEQEAVRDYFRASWLPVLHREPVLARVNAAEWLDLCEVASVDVAPLLAIWRRAVSTNAIRQLAWLIIMRGDLVEREADEGVYKQVNDWLRDPMTLTVLEMSARDYQHEQFVGELRRALGILAG